MLKYFKKSGASQSEEKARPSEQGEKQKNEEEEESGKCAKKRLVFNEEWLKLFSWLELRDGVMFCRPCGVFNGEPLGKGPKGGTNLRQLLLRISFSQ